MRLLLGFATLVLCSTASAQTTTVLPLPGGGTGVLTVDGNIQGGIGTGSSSPQPPRDRPPATGTSRIRGRVFAADTGQPLRRAMVRAAAPELRDMRSAVTDVDGRFEIGSLPAGRYNVSATRSGFVNMSYGQTRVNGTPKSIVLGENQLLDRVDIGLPRGAAITGRVVDEYGEPVANAGVQALQLRYAGGQRRPTPSSSPHITPDTGEFRLWGLAPGEYVISATLREPMMMNASESQSTGYAPSYYPGTPNPSEAQSVTVTAGQTLTGITIALTPTRTARISGQAFDAAGRPLTRGGVTVMPRHLAPFGGMNNGGPIRPDGTFVVANVPPGTYLLRAAIAGPGRGDGPPQFSQAEVVVNGEDISGVQLFLVVPVTVRGRVVIDPASAQALTPTALRVMLRPRNPEDQIGVPGFGQPESVKEDGTFELKAPPGAMFVQAMGGGVVGRMATAAVRLNGLDVTDSGVELRSGEDVTGLEVEVTTRTTSISGSVTDSRGAAPTDFTVIAFPQSRDLWNPQPPGRSAVARPTADSGRYELRTLRPGDYYIAAVTEVEPGQWTDPSYLEELALRATRVSIRDGESATIDLKITRSP